MRKPVIIAVTAAALAAAGVTAFVATSNNTEPAATEQAAQDTTAGAPNPAAPVDLENGQLVQSAPETTPPPRPLVPVTVPEAVVEAAPDPDATAPDAERPVLSDILPELFLTATPVDGDPASSTLQFPATPWRIASPDLLAELTAAGWTTESATGDVVSNTYLVSQAGYEVTLTVTPGASGEQSTAALIVVVDTTAT